MFVITNITLTFRDILLSCENTSSTNSKPTMACCFHDMCNHVDSPQVKDILNKTVFAGDATEVHQSFGNLPQQIDYTNSQVWFRAATIAVPVCGAVILVVLMFLAVKILRNESQNSTSRKLRYVSGFSKMFVTWKSIFSESN